MQIRIFDVVKLNNNNKAIIKNKENNLYKVEIIDTKGNSKNFKIIKEEDIAEILYTKNKK